MEEELFDQVRTSNQPAEGTMEYLSLMKNKQPTNRRYYGRPFFDEVRTSNQPTEGTMEDLSLMK